MGVQFVALRLCWIHSSWMRQLSPSHSFHETLTMTRLRHPSTSNQAWGLVGWLLLAFAAAAAGGFASASAGDFYRELVRPTWAPPGWLFGPVWSVLYAMMGVAAWLVWRARGFAGARAALLIFIAQLGVNALWTWLFFVWRQGGLAFAEILLLWTLIALTIALFWRVSRLAAMLLVPYLAWVSFASALNFATWRLNPSLLG
jgi:tryptophan-rich sensory protein